MSQRSVCPWILVKIGSFQLGRHVLELICELHLDTHFLFCTRLIEQWNISPEVKSNWYDCVLADAGHTFSVHKLWSRNKELDLTDLSPSLEAVQPCQHSTKPGGRIYVLWLRAMLLRQYRTSYWISISSGTVLCNWMCARQEFSGIGGCLWLFGWFCCCCWFVFVCF